MKLVFLYPNLTQKAGTERVCIDKLNYLADHAGYDIVILTYEQGCHPIGFPVSSKIKHIDFNIRFHSLYKTNRLLRLYRKKKLEIILQKCYNSFIKDFSPDIVATVTYYIESLRVIVKCPYKSIRILESHVDKRFLLNNDPTTKKDIVTRLRLLYESWGVNHFSKKFDILVALNQQDADDWAKHLKTTVITNMVHINNNGINSSLKNKRVIFAGRYSMEKGIFDLYKIWEIVYQKHPDWRLDLYGSGPLHDILEAKAKELDINIFVNKSTDNIFEKYRESSIFTLCSVFEAFGLVIPEAMSCGLPVVSFDCPFGPQQIITDGKDGFLVPNRDIRLFANRICNLIESEELRKKIGQEAVQTAKRYAPEKIIQQWMNLYQNLCFKT